MCYSASQIITSKTCFTDPNSITQNKHIWPARLKQIRFVQQREKMVTPEKLGALNNTARTIEAEEKKNYDTFLRPILFASLSPIQGPRVVGKSSIIKWAAWFTLQFYIGTAIPLATETWKKHSIVYSRSQCFLSWQMVISLFLLPTTSHYFVSNKCHFYFLCYHMWYFLVILYTLPKSTVAKGVSQFPAYVNMCYMLSPRQNTVAF